MNFGTSTSPTVTLTSASGILAFPPSADGFAPSMVRHSPMRPARFRSFRPRSIPQAWIPAWTSATRHLRSADFFDVAVHPAMKFEVVEGDTTWWTPVSC